MLQVQAAVRYYSRTLNRGMDITEFRGKVLDVINGMRQSMHSFPKLEEGHLKNETFLLLGGYSWRFAEFRLWTLHYDASLNGFTFRPASAWSGVDGDRLLAIVGDEVRQAKERLVALLSAKGKRMAGGFDMEPFEVLRDLIREQMHETIAGPPQLVKVYRHMNVTPFSVYWPKRDGGKVTMLGRELLHYERSSVGILDPDTLAVEPPAA